MPLRYRIYRSLRDSPGAGLRYSVLGALVFLATGGLMGVLDAMWGSPEYRWGMTVFLSFVTAFTALAVYAIVVELLGIDYADWKARGGS